MRRYRFIRHALVGVGLAIIGAYAAEILLRLEFTFPAPQMREAIRQGRYDTRTKLEVIRDLRRRGIPAYPAVLPSHFWGAGERQGAVRIPLRVVAGGRRIYPIGSISNVTTVFDNETGTYMIYQTDEHGFNNPLGLYSAAEVQIAAIGDSYTLGASVQPGENAVDLLRRSYPKTVNLGAAGTGPLVALATFREYVEPLRPDIVLWLFAESNDFDSAPEDHQPHLRAYLNDKQHRQGLRLLQGQIDRQVKSALDPFLDSDLAQGADRRPWVRFTGGTAINLLTLGALRARLGWHRSISAVDWDSLRVILTLMRDTTRSWGGEFYLVYIPYHVPGLERVDFNTAHRVRPEFFRMLRELSIPTLDVGEAWKAHPDPGSLFPFRTAGHPNALGYQVMGEAILGFLRDEMAAAAHR